MTVIEARGWGWRHAGRSSWAVRGLDLRIEAGERVLLLGASGAGKSTLLHALAGVLGGEDDGESEGELLIDGRPARAGLAGLVLQDPDSQVILERVGDDVAFGCENLGVPRDAIWPRVGAALDAVGLRVPLDHPTSRLSGGQKQRLALAGVLAMQPRLLLLDEPTANLDPHGIEEVRDAVGRVLSDTTATLVVVEHRVEAWWQLVHRVVVLEPGGGVRADGAPAHVLAREGAALAASGVWVPGFAPRIPRRAALQASAQPGDLPSAPTSTLQAELLLHTEALGIGRRTLLRDDLEVRIAAGTCLAVTGPNGSGKSTLGLTLGGLMPPVSGCVVADGLDRGAGPSPIRWRSRELVSRIGSVFQDPEHQFVTGTVLDELRVGLGATTARIDGRRARQRISTPRIDELLARLRLDTVTTANPFTLSGGEKRRLSVATALVASPPLLILDEPTFGQDARTWAELAAFLGELLDSGSAVVAITHDAALVDVLADSELRLSQAPEGRLAA